MKKVDYEHFARFLMPHSPKARGAELYFCVKRADLEENRYRSDLWVWKDGAARRLTSAGDVSGFWLTDDGVVFSALREAGIHKVALGHHYDDAVETMLMSLFLEGRISCFQPVTYLDRSGVTQIRPLLYVQEREVRGAVRRLRLPVVENPCPANGSTRREEMKVLLRELDGRYPNIKKKIFGAIQRYPLYGWSLEEEQR